MNLKHHTSEENLIKYSFMWSEARLAIAAGALFLGGVPPLTLVLSGSKMYTILNLAWLISGVSAAYLLYQWNDKGQRLFGHNDKKDTYAFFVMVISGINLGLVPILGNIGMSISSNTVIFWVVGIIYLLSLYQLKMSWLKHGKKVF